MKISELGEFELLNRLTRMVEQTRDKKSEAWQKLIIGIGDDTAAWQGDSSIHLATVDALRQDVHFSLEITPWEDLGWKALAVNLSDIAAMGGIPKYALISMALPEDTEVDNVITLYQGIIELAQRFNVAIVGGDTDCAPRVDITITVIGSNGGLDRPILTRSAAKPGDLIAVTGYLGSAAAGYEMLTRQLSFDTKAAAALKRAFLRPFPRVSEGQILVDCGVKAAIDISDGLLSDLHHICQASKVGAKIETERIPIQPEVKANFEDRALDLALSGGEDYELLFTASAEIFERVKTTIACPVTVIGEITADKAGQITLADGKGNPINSRRRGWEHFRKHG